MRHVPVTPPVMPRSSLSLRFVPLALAAATLAGTAGAQTLTPYNVLSFGSMTLTNSDVRGTVAVGGAASFSSWAVGAGLPASHADFALVVGGALTSTGGGQVNPLAGGGNPGARTWIDGGVVNNSGTATFPRPVESTAGGTPAPVDFVAEQARLRALSSDLGAMTSTGTVSGAGTLTFAGNGSGLTVFDVSAATLAGANSINFTGLFLDALDPASNSTFVINVTGAANGASALNYAGFGFFGTFLNFGADPGNQPGSNLNPHPATSRILFNFGACAVNCNFAMNGGVRGSILAPFHGVTLANGQVNGTVVAGTLATTSQIYATPFDGTVSSVPEPTTVALLGGGLLALGGLARRRRAA